MSGYGDEMPPMRIRLSGPDIDITATLLDNPTARDLASLLPLTLSFRDYASTEKIADPPRPLSTDSVPDGLEPDVGDITLYAPWGNLAIFYRDFGYAAGLIKLGQIDTGLEHLASLEGVITVHSL